MIVVLVTAVNRVHRTGHLEMNSEDIFNAGCAIHSSNMFANVHFLSETFGLLCNCDVHVKVLYMMSFGSVVRKCDFI